MLDVDLLKIKKMFDSSLKTREIAEASGLAYTTTDNLRKGITSIENASFRTLVKLTKGFNFLAGVDKKPTISLSKKIENVDASIGINKIDGIALSDEYIEKFYELANGKINRSEFDEFIIQRYNKQLID